MSETLTAADFEQRVHKVTERLEELRSTARPTAVAAGGYQYAGLDLTGELPELAPILGAMLHQDPDEPLTTNARVEVGGRRLALAGLITLLKGGEGLSDFAARYKVLTGHELDHTAIERVLPNAMREAGLPVPPKQDARRLLEALFVIAGLPASLVVATAEYFVHYWRLFHPQPSPLAPLEALADAPADWVTPEVRTALEALAKKLLPNAGVVAPALDGLTRVMGYLRTQPKRRIGDLFAHADEIAAGCGVDPKTLLHNHEDALAHLTAELGHAWHPEQFRHLLTGTPRGSEVRLPNGALAMVEKTVALPFWGTYRIEGKAFTVLPNEGLTIEAIQAMRTDGLWAEGNRAIYRGETQAEVFADGWPQLETPRHLFEEKQSLGWFYYHVPPVGRTLRVGDQELKPRAGIAWATSLFATLGDDQNPRLNARVAGLRVTLPELAGRTLQLECPQAETAGRLTFELDERGAGGLPEVLLTIADPKSGAFELYLQDHATGEVVTHGGKPLVHRVPMPEVMLFAEITGQAVPPSPVAYHFGVPAYLVFATRPINVTALQAAEIGVDKLEKAGDYEVNRLRWADAEQPLHIAIDPQFTWHFDYRVETVWQAAELPAPPTPLAYAPETPVGYTVATPDYLAVDDISLVENPLVVISREGQVLAAHSWDELNWMMNYPAENRRFSGLMLRRALHVAPEFDLAGRYMLSLKSGSQLLGERTLTILPKLDLTLTPSGAQLEDTRFTLKARCERPCFAGGLNELTIELGAPVVNGEAMENSPFQPKPLEATIQMQVPLFDAPIKAIADVIGFRLLDENEGTWIRKTHLNYEDLATITLVLFGANATTGTLKVGEDEALNEEFYEGFATFSLASVQETLRQRETEVQVAVDGRNVGTLVITWHPKVESFEAANEYLMENKASLAICIAGPEDVPLRLVATSPEGRELGTMEVRAASGEPQTVIFDLPASRDYPVITIKAYDPTEVTGTASGSVEVRNAAFEPEIEAINQRIAADARSADLRYERAQLLLDRGLRKAAARDFQAAIDLGKTELLDSPQYQQFMSQRLAESFNEDLKAIASFFVTFARKELNIG